jgi:uncharacterized protein YdaL
MRTISFWSFRQKLSFRILVFLLPLVLATLVWIKPRVADTANKYRSFGPIQVRQSAMTALVLYDGPAASGDGLITARYVANLLGHFGIRPEISNMSSYSTGQSDRFGVTFVCGMTAGTLVPQRLLQDIATSARPVCWINRHIKQLLSHEDQSARLGFAFVDYLDDSEFPIVGYKGFTLPKTDSEINLIHITDPSRAQVVATAVANDANTPYAIRSGSFWYFADSIFAYNTESDRSLVFADLLHDILGQQHMTQRRALIRIEDVSADSDPQDLRRVADLLHTRGIPFQVALIPIFRNPARRIELYLSDQPDVVEAVRYMVKQGGQIVLHGVTHQLHGESGDDFEFWDSLADKATPDGNPASVDHKLEVGLEECFRVGLYPVAWETPHYTCSLGHYQAFSQVFSHVYERRMVTDQNGTQQYFPYEAEDWMGQSVIPENLGYVNGEKPDPENIVLAADRLLCVRDGIASFFFHPFLDSRYLDIALDGILRDGYRFASITQFGCRVSLSDYAVATVPCSINPPLTHPYVRKTSVDRKGASIEEIEPVDSDKRPDLMLSPSDDGISAVQGVARPAAPRPETTLGRRILATFQSAPADELSPPRQRARKIVLALPTKPVLESGPLQDRLDVQGFESLVKAYGIPYERIELAGLHNDPLDAEQAQLLSDHLSNDSVLVIPRCAAVRMNPDTEQIIARWVSSGGRAVVEGRSRLAEQLGFDFSSRTDQVAHVRDTLFPDVPITWAHPQDIARFNAPPITQALVEDGDSHRPIAVASRQEEGTVIFLAADLDPQTGLGYGRFPYMFNHLAQQFGLAPPVRRAGAEFYFDPGYREQAPIERLVKSWRRDGVRAIYAAAWHFYPHWNYDYDTMIKECHEQGIAVYAWFELPQVSQKFWDDHPEWREKTATGRDANIGWRLPMNLADDDCRAAVLNFVSDLMASHDWDGINIAELCFDTSDGLKDRDGYVPMNDAVRSRFEHEAGFDPILVLDPKSEYYWQKNQMAVDKWSKFRSGLVRRSLVDLLERIEPLRASRQLDVICTALDSLNLPRVTERTGTDIRDVLALMDQYRFTVQVEDPAEAWGTTPIRYADYGQIYKKQVSDPERLMFDINVVHDPSRIQSPTELLSGTELALAVRSAAEAGNGRVGIYSEASVSDEDRAELPIVLGGLALFTATPAAASERAAGPPPSASRAQNVESITTVGTVRLRLDSQTSKGGPGSGHQTPGTPPVLDGDIWQCGGDGEIIVPPGQHWFGGTPREQALIDRLRAIGSGTALLRDITAEVQRVSRTGLGLAVDYQSPRRAWAALARKPIRVHIDGVAVEMPVMAHREGEWILQLPAGSHRVEIDDETIQAAAVDAASVISSRTIVWFGEYFVLALLIIYAGVRIRRLGRRAFPRTLGPRSPVRAASGPLRTPKI